MQARVQAGNLFQQERCNNDFKIVSVCMYCVRFWLCALVHWPGVELESVSELQVYISKVVMFYVWSILSRYK